MQNGFSPTEEHLRVLVDSFPIHKSYGKPLLGNYLFVNVQQEDIIIELKVFNTISATLLHNQRDLMLQVLDSLGLAITDAKVDLDGKEVPFSEKAKAYQLKKWRKEGLLRIQANGEVLLHKLIRNNGSWTFKDSWRAFKRTRFGRIVRTPFRIVTKPYHYVKRGIGYGDWGIGISWKSLIPFRRLYYRIKNKNRNFKGYIVTNQPKYLPGDTVKVKAYATKPNGKPFKKELRFKFAHYYRGYKHFIDKEVLPNSPGNYTYEFVLGDSLVLDKEYRVSFYDSKYRRGGLSRSFRYEDYQLDDLKWTFSAQREAFAFGEPVILKAEGKTASGLTVPDGEVELILLTNMTYDYYEDEIYIPDTLWQHSQLLKTRGETMIIVPDSIFPPINAEVKAIAKFQNSNGELQQKTSTFKVSKQQEYIDLDIKNGYLRARYIQKGKSIPFAGAQLEKRGRGRGIKHNVRDTIDLPFEVKLNHAFSFYKVYTDKIAETLAINNSENGKSYKPEVSVSGFHRKDSVYINITNPNLTAVVYQVFKERKLVGEGVTKDAYFQWTKKDRAKGNYEVRYNYIWGGQSMGDEAQVIYVKKRLTVNVEQVRKVSPGETVPVKVKVTKHKGKAAKNVNLTAGAINSKFKESKSYDAPSIAYKSPKELKEYGTFSLRIGTHSTRWNIDQKRYNAYGLDSLFYYQCRFQDEGLVLRYDTVAGEFYKDIAQFAPHVVKNGLSQPIYMIYVNRRLVYYYDVNDQPRYSFIGKEGRNLVVIRTRDAEYSLDVMLKNGNKLELILDENNFEKIPLANRFRKKSTPKLLTPMELSLLKKSIFVLNTGVSTKTTKYLWQGNQIHQIGVGHWSTELKLGPFTPGVALRYMEQDGFIHTFRYDEGYTYQISSKKEKLVKNTLFEKGKEYTLPTRVKDKELGQIVYAPSQIVAKKTTYTGPQYIQNFTPKFENTGQLKIEAAWMRDTITTVILENENDSLVYVYPGHNNGFGELEEGLWTIHLVKSSGAYYKMKKEIKRNELLFLRLNDIEFTPDTTKSILYKYTVKPTKKLKEILSLEEFDFLKKRKTGMMGKIGHDVDSLSVADIKIKVITLDGLLIAETVTDDQGYYQLEVLEGKYDIEIDAGNDRKKTIKGFYVKGESSSVLDFMLTESYEIDLLEIIIFGYRIPMIEQDKTSTGYNLTSDHISKIPSRSVNAIVATTAGVSSDNIMIRGSRANASDYYVDGVKVRGISTIDGAGKGSIVGKVTDAKGEELIGVSILVTEPSDLNIGTITGIDGDYQIYLTPGIYSIEVSYTGFTQLRKENVLIGANQVVVLDIVLDERADLLNEVVVVGYGVNRMGFGGNKKEQLSIESDNDNASLPEGIQLRSNFQDYAYWQPNLVTDKNGEAYFEARYPDNITSWNSYVIGMDRKKRAGLATQSVKAYKDLVAELAIPRFLVAGDKADIIGKAINFTNKTYDIETEFLLGRTESIQQNEARIKDALIERASVEAPIEQDSLTMTYQISAGAYGDGEERSIPIFPQGVEETLGGFYVLEGDTTLTVPVNDTYGETNIYIQDNVIAALLRDLKYLHDYPYSCNEQTASRLMGLLLQKKVNEQLGEPFSEKKEKWIEKCLARLKKTQNLDGSWGWWDGGNANIWMTTHVLRALHQANQDGYATTPLTNGWRYLTNNLNLFTTNELIKSLELLSDINQNMDYGSFLTRLDTLDLNQHQRFITYKIRQENGLPYSLDSLTQSRKETVFGSYYWGNKTYNWGNNSNQNTLLAYEIYKKAGDEATAKKILNYLMEARALRTYYGCRIGRNTYEISKVLNVILPDLLADVSSRKDLKTNITLESGFRDTITHFPYESSFISTKNLTITKQGAGAVYLTTYQQFHNPQPKAKDDLFEVTSTLLQKGKETKDLQQGEKATLKVTVEVKKSADYIMIEIPIPAGCSYYSKPQKWGYPTVHKE